MSAFDALAQPVQKWIRAKGWIELKDIQARTVHAVLESNADLIVSAATAGGKTEAAFLPLISQLIEARETGPEGFDVVYIGPLKALINDQYKRLDDMCFDTGVPVTPWHGDIAANIKQKARKKPKGILLITPESLEALLVRKGTQISRLFGQTKAIVIDELHTFLDTERGVQLRSLLTRLEIAVGHRTRRIGLSATLGDMELTKAYLRPQNADKVELLKATEAGAELKMQVRGYMTDETGTDKTAVARSISTHLFDNLRGTNNLVFAGARKSVEEHADHLRILCEEARVPQEFYPHHASLSRDHREFIETRLKKASPPTTAVCTSTLELGVDIGDVTCVAQIGAPFTVAGLRQRLGRSGRRSGQPAILRQYAVEAATDQRSDISDRLRLRLIRSIAMIELLLEGWYEPPKSQALHLSTLVHQILAVIAERGGASAKRLFITLCQKGPFTSIDQATFVAVLKHIGDESVGLIDQIDNGTLLLGPVGEKLVEHYSFFPVFKTPEEYRLVYNGKELGTLPLDNILAPKMTIIFSGRRWEVVEVSNGDKVILVKPSSAGALPTFGGDPGDIHDRVIQKMRDIFTGNDVPVYLDTTAKRLLQEARENFALYGLESTCIVRTGENSYILATWFGTAKTLTLALAMRSLGFKVQTHDGFLELNGKDVQAAPRDALQQAAKMQAADLFETDTNLQFEKFHPYLSTPLLQRDALSAKLDIDALPSMVRNLLAQ